jgi:hypothetical protein
MGRKKAPDAPPAKRKPFKIAGRVMPLGDRDKAIAEAIGRVDAVYNDAATEARKVKGEARIPFWKLQLETVAVHARILGLEAPTKMQIQSESQVTVVDRTHQALLADPAFRQLQMRLEQRAIDITGGQIGDDQGSDAHGTGSQGDGSTVDDQAASPDDQRSLDGRGFREE